MSVARVAAGALACAALVLPCAAFGDRPAVLDHPIAPDKPPAAFAEVNRRLREGDPIRAEFVEEKRLSALKRPLVSSGSIVFSRKLGLYRSVASPRAQELLVTRERVVARDARGKVETFDVAKQPVAKGFVDALLLVLSGDEKALSERFDLYFDGDAERWTLGFVPKQEPFSKVIASIVVAGHGAAIDEIAVRETSGDSTVAKWSNVVLAKPLDKDEEARWFRWAD